MMGLTPVAAKEGGMTRLAGRKKPIMLFRAKQPERVKMKKYALVLILASFAGMAFAQFSLDLETGLAFFGYNDMRIPNLASGRILSLTDELESKPKMFGRANLHYQITPRHEISLLASPFTIEPSGEPSAAVEFMGRTYAAREWIYAVYKFNSYRLQYLYRFEKQNIGIRALGVSLKVLDALISLENKSAGYTEKTDLGVVPLIGFEFGYDLSEELALLLKGEALASPYGRAEDILLALVYDLNGTYSLYAGYRFLEGGSDIEEVYTFANINYLSLGTRINF